MVSNDLQGRSRLRRIALPASFLVGLGISAASCAADLADPDAYTVARNQGVGSGGTPAATGGTVGATGGSKAIGGATGTGGGATATGGTTGANPPLTACAKAIFTSCAASCHSTALVPFPTVGGGLDLSGDNVAMRLVGVAAKNNGSPGKAGCGALIDAAMNAESVLLKRVKGTDCGQLMPTGGMLTPTEQQCLTDWVNMF